MSAGTHTPMCAVLFPDCIWRSPATTTGRPGNEVAQKPKLSLWVLFVTGSDMYCFLSFIDVLGLYPASLKRMAILGTQKVKASSLPKSIMAFLVLRPEQTFLHRVLMEAPVW